MIDATLIRELSLAALLISALVYWVWSSKDDENVGIKGALRKFWWYIEGLTFMATSKDAKGIGNKLTNPDLLSNCTNVTSKAVVFIRHGESDWNDVFK